MPKLTGQCLPRYCKPRQSGQAVVYLNGRDVLLGPYRTAASRREYDRVIAEWIANVDASPPAANSRPRINEFRKWSEQNYRNADGKLTSGWEAFRVVLQSAEPSIRIDLLAATFRWHRLCP